MKKEIELFIESLLLFKNIEVLLYMLYTINNEKKKEFKIKRFFFYDIFFVLWYSIFYEYKNAMADLDLK